MRLKRYLEEKRGLIDKAFTEFLPSQEEYPPSIHRALHYSLEGGKRIRPILTLAACEAVGGKVKEALPAACGIELIHAFSLVHDDLPCMDNDDFRRGQPSVHKKFGEAVALLAGDALLTIGFGLLLKKGTPAKKVQVAQELSRAIGTRGMIGGQVAELELNGKELDLPKLEYIHTHKTGALIAASLKVGGILGGGRPKEVEELFKFGEYIGFTFQIVDDIIDGEGYCLLFDRKGAEREAERLTLKAKTHLKRFGTRGEILANLADLILHRTQ
ncbi:MAG: polyprenyl synthetase family protein [Candidatus Omnitrophica bacterium]|nr:polyprenyl synthetase family protein [Candidatus Omnitrophota bacterium]